MQRCEDKLLRTIYKEQDKSSSNRYWRSTYTCKLCTQIDYKTSKYQKKINLRIDILEKIRFEFFKRDERLDDESYE